MLSIIVPAYNEEQRLPATLVRMRAYLDGRGEPYEVLVVDDGSSDNTLAISRTIAEGWPQLQVLALDRNTGKGAAVRLGMLSATGEHRLFSDADLSTPIEEVEQLRARLQGNTAVAIASRALPDSQIDVHQPGRREVMGRTYNRLLRLAALRGLVGVHVEVPGVDLDQIVQHDHGAHFGQVGPGRSMLAEHQRHQGQVPGVLRRVLPPRAVVQRAAPQHALEPVGLEHETELAVQGVHVFI